MKGYFLEKMTKENKGALTNVSTKKRRLNQKPVFLTIFRGGGGSLG